VERKEKMTTEYADDNLPFIPLGNVSECSINTSRDLDRRRLLEPKIVPDRQGIVPIASVIHPLRGIDQGTRFNM
jgi:hypothetical protein